MNIKEIQTVACTVDSVDVIRVKGLGCLRDKTTPDCFNCRVLTRNGRITAAESHAIAEAAEKFGSGLVAMTTRQTVEIQGVPYENVEPMRVFFWQHMVSRPVVPAQKFDQWSAAREPRAFLA